MRITVGRRPLAAAQRQKGFFIYFALVLMLAFTGCNRGGGDAREAARSVPVFAVNTTLAIQGQIQDHISFSGDIHAGSTVDVFSDVAGRVSEVFTSVGRTISRGQPVAAVDPSRPGMVFRDSIAEAPISGTIIALPAQVGMTVSQAVPLARISGGGGYEIRLNIPERFISRIALNLPCEITLDAWPGEVFHGSITEMSPTVDLASRTMEVRVDVSDVTARIRPGMFARVRIILESKDNIVKIPASAVITRFGEQFVFVIEQDPENEDYNIVRRQVLTPGIVIDGIMEVQSGLEAGEEIVVRGQTLLDDGSRVNVIERVFPLGERP